MTQENKILNIREELERGERALLASTVLFDHGLYSDAISRLYYHLLYQIRALLLTKGLEPRSHEGALRLLSLHFVKNGPFEASLSHLFSRLMKYREEADYNPSYVFTSEDVIALRKDVENHVRLICEYINASGFDVEGG